MGQEFRGKYRASEALLWVGHGVTDWLAIEFKAAVIKGDSARNRVTNSVNPVKESL